ncbi:A/G-specific adenine glycosylase [Gloeocapsopsis dulcis]|uniref:A/G-specific adenine glycosylase n=1 Tax=Gloeocapsopsis dulcis AAB1 = 1H9 TaxID=1433147 RepID=A0A6N8G0N6_9CHRO|nr:A/G-specific adenine glycosylase [Gloeocapsopsis dulcis]MUL38145.1 A/G-specific adenine glycosylase [Gloeocapsopsis dulcis AAB1 = 1H9]WNN89407.1 A/G-specific adenine glycosylase [Gloeocapsopsis dulcis]
MTLNSCTKKLLEWYDNHQRLLPWRQEINVYHTWVSEVMSQQTVMAVVVIKFSDFIKQLPTVYDLAACDEETLRQLWSGLGYYARARNLKKGAQLIVEQLYGRFPQSYEEWLKIPGCGAYTASAIASICYHEKVACVDGNVIRVVSRLLALSDVWSKSGQSAIQAYVNNIIPAERPGDFNQAMMELGATICRKSNPLCNQCPLQEHCLAFTNNCIAQCPPKKPRRTSVNVELFALIIWHTPTDTLALVKRTKGFLAKTIGFPLISNNELLELERILDTLPKLQLLKLSKNFPHTITHHRISGKVLIVQAIEEHNDAALVLQKLGFSEYIYWIKTSNIVVKLATTLDKKVFQLFSMQSK